ncbi:biotin-dependent carboxyltransferase family protein [Psychroflexus sp. YR1-1]|uniref:Biotin-dependent carboxyltransferase family protein n=1 Tax=Psychroflexus aurantiacus TaxID=2709310 RepID=A0A6B3R4T3_9FLAO|nr:biotin-dependent carboxyltransferase family protein [Psychroflexus aurantiacus]NEV94177.1 biotin-dependent carboxyltransferase family protein [Psychroflexus aurantiacus]
MSLLIKHPGLFSTVQDQGRSEGMPQGIPVSGAMDLHLYRYANQVLNNTEDCACIEFYQQGLKLEFEAPTFICVAALDAVITLNAAQAVVNSVLQVSSGDVLTIKELTRGSWGYVAVKEGFLSQSLLGSRSFFKALTRHQIQKNDQLDFSVFEGTTGGDVLALDTDYYAKTILEVYKGPEFHKLSETLQYQLKTAKFSLSTSQNRMAYQLQERLENELDEIVTGPVLPGTIQYTPEGKMIVLMRDAQVTGGYPRILQLSERGINQLSQMRTKTKFTFGLTEIGS